MTEEWETLYQRALAVAKPRNISERVEAGWVGAALLGRDGNIYTGVSIDTACSLGMCAERAAVAAMLTAGEGEVRKVCAVSASGEQWHVRHHIATYEPLHPAGPAQRAGHHQHHHGPCG